MEPVSCIVPAAGRSSRMGDWKPLLPFGGSTILQTVVRTALSACARVIVVTGYRGSELADVFGSQAGVILASNPEWQTGMFSSIRIGAAKVDTERFFVTLGDKPFIPPEVYTALLQYTDGDAVFPVFGGTRGHPVLLNRAVREAVLAADARTGSMPAVIARFRTRELAWPDDSILKDVDTPDQLRSLHR